MPGTGRPGTGRITYRTATVPKRLFTHNRGFVTVNDAPAMASQLARYLASSSDPPETRDGEGFGLRGNQEGQPPAAQ